jgi:hypothetical protein
MMKVIAVIIAVFATLSMSSGCYNDPPWVKLEIIIDNLFLVFFSYKKAK